MFKARNINSNAAACIAELREHIARLEMQLRQPRVCQHEPKEVPNPHTYSGRDVPTVTVRCGSNIVHAFVCKHCNCLYTTKE